MDKRFEKISELFINYSQGNFDHKIELTEQLDEIDAFISSINMLGEELKSTTISKNYFNNIFNSVSEMLFVLNEKGFIEKANKSVFDMLNIYSNLEQMCIDNLITVADEKSFFHFMKKKLNSAARLVEVESTLNCDDKIKIPVRCVGNYLYNEGQEKIGYLIRAKDLSNIKKIENSLKQSEEKYRKLFEESSDCIFIIDSKGGFINLNTAGLVLFQLTEEELQYRNYFDFFNGHAKDEFLQLLARKRAINSFKTKLKCKERIIECLISATKIIDDNNTIIGYQGIIKDVTGQQKTENLIIRTIIDTQEKERIRFAKDIHDGLGQQLSAIKFYLGTMASSDKESEKNTLLSKSNEALTNVLADLRNICFNLMPKTLENFGLIKAVDELCRQNEFAGLLNFHVVSDKKFPTLEKPLEIAVFRIIQEFINNSIKHGKAKNIYIFLRYKRGEVQIMLKDDGIGFDTKKINAFSGMGLKNVMSRIQSYNGEIKIKSTVNKETKYEITIPVNPIKPRVK